MMLFEFTVVKGHQVASGLANDPRFPHGTIHAQIPYFKALGLNLIKYYPATLNAKFNYHTITLNHYDYYFTQVKWHQNMPAENFKFSRCRISTQFKSYSALIYQPQILTKSEHMHPMNQLEILAPFIEDIHYGDLLTLEISNQALTILDA